jgi:prepilin-type processing-associated H-X9-DG protein
VPWAVCILPYLEDDNRYYSFTLTGTFGGLFDQDDSLTTANNRTQQLLRNRQFECPSDPNSNDANANSNYFGIMGGAASVTDPACCHADPTYPLRIGTTNGILYTNSHVKTTDVTDGTTNTYLVGETRYLPLKVTSGQHAGSWASNYYWAAGPYAVTLAACVNALNSSAINPARAGPYEVQTNTLGSYHPGGANFLLGDGSVAFVGEGIDVDVFRQRGIRNDGLPLGNP